MTSAPGQPSPPSHRSLLRTARGDDDASGRAWQELAGAYRLPVYAYLRRRGESAASAERVGERFLERLRQRAGARLPEDDGDFADFLKQHLAQERSDALPAAPAGDAPRSTLERDYAEGFPAGCDPGQCFDRALALGLMARALQQLRGEAVEAGHEPLLDEMLPYLAQEPPHGQYEAWARHHGVPGLTLLLALRRLRQRFRELVDRGMMEIAGARAGSGPREAMRRLFEEGGA
jgi:hypothetical protein